MQKTLQLDLRFKTNQEIKEFFLNGKQGVFTRLQDKGRLESFQEPGTIQKIIFEDDYRQIAYSWFNGKDGALHQQFFMRSKFWYKVQNSEFILGKHSIKRFKRQQLGVINIKDIIDSCQGKEHDKRKKLTAA